MFTSQRLIWNIWRRDIWRKTVSVTGSASLPTRKTRTNYGTSESAQTMMMKKITSKQKCFLIESVSIIWNKTKRRHLKFFISETEHISTSSHLKSCIYSLEHLVHTEQVRRKNNEKDRVTDSQIIEIILTRKHFLQLNRKITNKWAESYRKMENINTANE